MPVAAAQVPGLPSVRIDNAAVSAVLYCRKRLSWLGDASLVPARNSLNAEPMGATSTPHDSTIPAAVPAESAISAFVGASSSGASAKAAGDARCIAAATAIEIVAALNHRLIFHLPFAHDSKIWTGPAQCRVMAWTFETGCLRSTYQRTRSLDVRRGPVNSAERPAAVPRRIRRGSMASSVSSRRQK